MENLIMIENAKVCLNREEVFRIIDCYKDSPIYEEVLEEYEEIVAQIVALCRPVVLLKFAGIDDQLVSEELPAATKVVYALYSIGPEVSNYSTNAFSQGDYLKGMLSDAMADSLLFSLEKETAQLLRQECAKRHVGIVTRLEAPGAIPMAAQQVIHRETEAERQVGIKISSGYMFEPVKSNGIVFVLTDNEAIFRNQHDCRKCDRKDCKMRHIPEPEVVVQGKEKTYSVFLQEGESILDGLQRSGTYVSAVCGGKGTCGKCKIRLIEGQLPITEFDLKAFSSQELEQGYRLACKAYTDGWAVIETEFQKEEEFEILSDYDAKSQTAAVAGEKVGIAIDIGTTTIALQLLGLTSGQTIDTYVTINRQRAYGADVISRIKASCDGKGSELQQSIREDLHTGITKLMAQSGMQAERLGKIVIAGNTTMIHLLMGYHCESLGVYPFTPVNIEAIEISYRELIAADGPDAMIYIVPGISTYVGGDITAGMLQCGFDKTKSHCVLIDLGTNGEMAIGNSEGIIVTSTAAGPAFEGGNIQWGTGSVPGAINSVRLNGTEPVIGTIADKPPVGICGTGVIECVAELVREEIVESSGLLDEDYFDDGFPLAQSPKGEPIVFTQQDVREIQLAKAAVRAGLETMVRRYGVAEEEIETVYLAGGFGFRLDVDKAISIGMFPESFQGKIKTAGNSSLGGAAVCLLEQEGQKRLQQITAKAREINLSSDKDFNNFYMDAMFFEENI